MSSRPNETGYSDENGDDSDREHGYTRPRLNTEDDEMGDDSVLVFEFLRRKRTLPSPRRLDLMLSVPQPLTIS